MIGLVLLATAAGKLADLAGFAAVLETYRFFGGRSLLPIAFAIAAVELALAVWLFSGWRIFAAASAAAILHVLYAGWSAAALARGLRLDNCGCFGVFWKRPLTWSTVYQDLAMTGIAAALVLVASRRG